MEMLRASHYITSIDSQANSNQYVIYQQDKFASLRVTKDALDKIRVYEKEKLLLMSVPCKISYGYDFINLNMTIFRILTANALDKIWILVN